MKIWKGVGASAGVAEGVVVALGRKRAFVPKRVAVADSEAELYRFESARKEALTELEQLQKLARHQVGKQEAEIFMAHAAMLEDETLLDEVKLRINSSVNAEFALYEAVEQLAELFSAIEDDYLKERVMDLRDVSQRLMNKLTRVVEQKPQLPDNAIILAQDLLPSQTIQLDKNKVKAFLTMEGSPNSHAAILARTREIPAVVAMGEGISEIKDGSYLIVDGENGTVYESPDQDIIQRYRAKKARQDAEKAALNESAEGECRTKSGRLVRIKANVGTLDDVPEALAYHCDGIGLTRSEYIYMQSSDWPDEDSQFEFYTDVLASLPDTRVTIRTCDLGMDKTVSYWFDEKEENPALGMRGIRLSLSKPETFFTQIRALLRASAYGQLSIMFPMVSSEGELDKALELAREAREELESEGVAMGDDVHYGVMIETPAAAVLADVLAKKMDFFSIGTNDLTQYTLCVDRVNPKVANLYDPCHPAVLRLVKNTIDAIHKEGKTCGICGDAATNPHFAKKAIDMGIDSLSVPPRRVPNLKKLVRNCE
ncbi:MAG: phosphoenolpyruvate--protein phosphotransferase [Ruminococcaceae bacterium]|nr:phosphoenolpyruvate--protein phosphotransferase [Oscillospiraceae bacterium]